MTDNIDSYLDSLLGILSETINRLSEAPGDNSAAELNRQQMAQGPTVGGVPSSMAAPRNYAGFRGPQAPPQSIQTGGPAAVQRWQDAVGANGGSRSAPAGGGSRSAPRPASTGGRPSGGNHRGIARDIPGSTGGEPEKPQAQSATADATAGYKPTAANDVPSFWRGGFMQPDHPGIMSSLKNTFGSDFWKGGFVAGNGSSTPPANQAGQPVATAAIPPKPTGAPSGEPVATAAIPPKPVATAAIPPKTAAPARDFGGGASPAKPVDGPVATAAIPPKPVATVPPANDFGGGASPQPAASSGSAPQPSSPTPTTAGSYGGNSGSKEIMSSKGWGLTWSDYNILHESDTKQRRTRGY